MDYAALCKDLRNAVKGKKPAVIAPNPEKRAAKLAACSIPTLPKNRAKRWIRLPGQEMGKLQ